MESAFGSDLYLDGEHTTIWQIHDQNQSFQEMKIFLQGDVSNFSSQIHKKICYANYQKYLQYENYVMQTQDINYIEQPDKLYRFYNIGSYDIAKLNQKFDIIYCKAIEHIHDWNRVFESMSSILNKNGIIYFKHRSFFSYLGAHRYSSIGLPWGYLLLTDLEYNQFFDHFYPEFSQKIKDFYINDLSYPRKTVSDMLKIAQNYHCIPIVIINEPVRYIDKIYQYVDDVQNFWDIIQNHYSGLSVEKMFSRIFHIIFRKI